MTERNESCPCGSGKKFKKCCIDKPVEYGSCSSCGQPGCGALVCNLCGRKHPHCHAHHEDARTMMKGHVLRVHPESVPGIVDKLMKSEKDLAIVRAEAALEPELWKRLLEYISGRQN
jgi:hypothetical protein